MSVKITSTYINTPDVLDIRNFSNLQEVIDYAAGKPKILLLTSDVTVDSDIEIPENIWVVQLGGKFNIQENKTLTVNCRISGTKHVLFSGPGRVQGAPITDKIYDEWFSETVNRQISHARVISGVVIQQPRIINPVDGQIDFQGVIQSSPFATTESFAGPHDASDWEIATDSEFNNIVVASYNDTANLTTFAPSGLEPNTTYYVRVRYRSEFHLSPWSNPVRFSTPSSYIETPTITCTTGDSLYPVFRLSSFTAYGYDDNWQSTEWEIATDPNFNDVIRSHTETNSEYQSVWSITDDLLDVNSTYYVRARYNGDQGHSSNWSDSYVLNTGLYRIEFDIPTQVNEEDTIDVHVTHDNGREFDTSQYTLQGIVSHGVLTTSGMNIAWKLPEINQDTVVTITLWVTRNFDNVDVTERSTKSLTVKDVALTTDTAVVILDFSDCEYNDGWILD